MAESDQAGLRQRLSTFMKRMECDQEAIAAAIDCSASTISRFINEVSDLAVDNALKLNQLMSDTKAASQLKARRSLKGDSQLSGTAVARDLIRTEPEIFDNFANAGADSKVIVLCASIPIELANADRSVQVFEFLKARPNATWTFVYPELAGDKLPCLDAIGMLTEGPSAIKDAQRTLKSAVDAQQLLLASGLHSKRIDATDVEKVLARVSVCATKHTHFLNPLVSVYCLYDGDRRQAWIQIPFDFSNADSAFIRLAGSELRGIHLWLGAVLGGAG